MKQPYRVMAVSCLLIAAFVASESLALRFYTPLGPGPGFFPFWLAVLLGILATTMLVQTARQGDDAVPDGFFPKRDGCIRIAAVLVSLFGTAAMLNTVGFRIAMFVFYEFLLLALGRKNILVNTLIAFSGSFGVYHIFVDLLTVPLPIGGLGI